jgi:hypothetical protein
LKVVETLSKIMGGDEGDDEQLDHKKEPPAEKKEV